MATIEEILGKCSVVELRDAADGNGVSRKGAKAELVSRLASSVPLKKALEYMSKDQIQEVLAKYERPRSGNKDELIGRVLALVRAPRKETQKQEAVRKVRQPVDERLPVQVKETTHSKGAKFEDQVARWARKRFGTEFAERCFARGNIGHYPHQVDVHVRIPRSFGRTHDIWIECKDMQSSVKRTDVSKLVGDAKQVYKAHAKGIEKFYFNGLMFVSTSSFDSDALQYANDDDVLCVQFDGRGYKEMNKPENWLGKPKWLREVEYTAGLF